MLKEDVSASISDWSGSGWPDTSRSGSRDMSRSEGMFDISTRFTSALRSLGPPESVWVDRSPKDVRMLSASGSPGVVTFAAESKWTWWDFFFGGAPRGPRVRFRLVYVDGAAVSLAVTLVSLVDAAVSLVVTLVRFRLVDVDGAAVSLVVSLVRFRFCRCRWCCSVTGGDLGVRQIHNGPNLGRW